MSWPPRILVTGVTGLLGNAIVREALHQDLDVSGVSRNPSAIPLGCPVRALDITDQKATAETVARMAPDVLIHTAAMTSVDQCQSDPDAAFAVNVGGTRNLLRALEGKRCRFILISTDSIFDGAAGNYRETDAPAPLHVYGSTKLQAENDVRSARPDALIVRTAFYGWNMLPQNSLAEWILSTLADGKPFTGFTDLSFSPLLTDHLARLLLRLSDMPAAGPLHVAGSTACSKYEFARELAALFGFPAERIVPITRETTRLPVPRPKNVTLCVEKAAALLGPLPPLRKGLHDFHATRELSHA